MKSWALVIVVIASVMVPFHKAEAKKAPKAKVVVISFSEEDAQKRNRAPASADEKREQAAQARHIARLSQVEWNLPDEM